MSTDHMCPEFVNLCHNLTTLRRQHQLSKRAMMGILHVSLRTLNSIEAGVLPRGMDPRPLFYAAAYFGIRPSDLLRVWL